MKDKLLNAMSEAKKRTEKVSFPDARDIPALMRRVSETKNSKERRLVDAMLLTAFGL